VNQFYGVPTLCTPSWWDLSVDENKRIPQFVGVFDNRGVRLEKGTADRSPIFAILMVDEVAYDHVESVGIITICIVRC
jgi:hypothetical protein